MWQDLYKLVFHYLLSLHNAKLSPYNCVKIVSQGKAPGKMVLSKKTKTEEVSCNGSIPCYH
ncbi:hypothetical protein Slip_1152 [Syntrophothermus lipocalidus DSM 12680]|uniref:Uncharacterized protein n=1 Tax=Syntrophothermus lipocalidus (strain DSM 12680 / TGB-C1) TaxID=643648 RepID=D7CMJ1_SYNLT|nr:hypothetical protein Slip_1152 [Syntrophothermus lipocalidus DSM 12680]